ncbi:MAG: hypothetical protein QM679_08120 [Patulibacter sp.]
MEWSGSGEELKTNSSLDLKGWEPVTTDSRSFELSQSKTLWEGRGLYAKADLTLLSGTGTAEWRYRAPGTSTIYKTEYAPSTFNLLGCLNEGMRKSDGSWQDTVNSWPGHTPRSSYHPTACGVGVLVGHLASAQVILGNPGAQVFCSNAATPCVRTGSPIGNQAVFGIQRMGLAQPWFAAYLPGARVFQTDYDRPTLGAGTNSHPNWVRHAIVTVTATATDTGLGVKKINLSYAKADGSTASQGQSLPCSGDRNDRCAASWNTAKPSYKPSFTYDTDDLPEGVVPFGVKATDNVDNQSLPADGPNTALVPPAKIDRSAPVDIAGTGEIADLDSHWFRGEDTKTITATARDIYSGVKTLQIEKTDGTVLASETFNCANDQCPNDASKTLSLDTTQIPEGETVVRLRATDLVGNTAIGAPWTLRIDRTPPTIEGAKFDAGFEEEDGGHAVFSWGMYTDELSGVATSEYRRDGENTWTSTIEEGDIVDYPAGTVTFVAYLRVTDYAGNVRNITLSGNGAGTPSEGFADDAAAVKYLREQGLSGAEAMNWIEMETRANDVLLDLRQRVNCRHRPVVRC